MALYSNLPIRLLELASHRKEAYEVIDQTAVLDQVIRQNGNNAKSFIFRTALIELYSDFISNLT